jgi:hypothetical protein
MADLAELVHRGVVVPVLVQAAVEDDAVRLAARVAVLDLDDISTSVPLRCSGWKTKSPSRQLLPPVAVDAGSTSPWADLPDGRAGADADDTAAAAAALWVTVGFFFEVCAQHAAAREQKAALD